jgi:hypothetical protein
MPRSYSRLKSRLKELSVGAEHGDGERTRDMREVARY